MKEPQSNDYEPLMAREVGQPHDYTCARNKFLHSCLPTELTTYTQTSSGLVVSFKSDPESQIQKTSDEVSFYLAPGVGLEPTTSKLTASCSTIELPGNIIKGALNIRYATAKL